MLIDQRNEHFRQALAAAIARAVEFPRGIFVTIAEAKISANQKNAMGLLSVYPFERRREALATLDVFRREIKAALAQSLRLRRIPEITWKIDEREENVGRIDQTIEELKQRREL